MSKNFSQLTEPEDWEEWFEKCAWTLCSDETKSRLGIFAKLRYEQALKKALSFKNKSEDDLPPDARELIRVNEHGVCWRDLEASYWYDSKENPDTIEKLPTEGAKTYKSYYRERAATFPDPNEARNYLEGCCTKFLIWTRCRSIVIKSIPRPRFYMTESGKTFEDLALEKKQGAASNSDYLVADMKDQASSIFSLLSAEERVLLHACFNQIPLGTLPELADALGRKSSALYQRQSKAKIKIRPLLDLGEKFPQEITPHIYAGGVLDQLTQLLNIWAISPECEFKDCIKSHEVSH